MDLLRRELELKKKVLHAAKAKKASTTKFVKTSELRRWQDEIQEDNEAVEKAQLSGNDDSDGCNKSKRDRKEIEAEQVDMTAAVSSPNAGETKRRKTQAVSSTTGEDDNDGGSAVELSEAEITKRLRNLRQPVRLFGEQNRRWRLREAEQAEAVHALHRTEEDEFRLNQGHGIRNPFLEKDTTTTTGSGIHGGGGGALSSARDAAILESELAVAKASKMKNQKDKESRPDAARDDLDPQDPHKRVYRYFKDLLKQWEVDLNERSDVVKQSVAGKNETKTHKQCKDYIRPLFQQCKRRQLEEGLLHKLVVIVDCCLVGEFVRAHDAYIDVAIGRAAWPIGVTMVGIHARSGRAKIESANVAHVMNSELQRKYLTSVKRLVTYAQKKRTDVAPSKKVV